MDFPPILPEYTIAYSNLSSLYNFAGRVFGRLWSLISKTPHQIYQIVLTIKIISERCFYSDSKKNQGAEAQSSPLNGSKCPRWRHVHEQDDPLNALDCNLHGICTSPKSTHIDDGSLNQLDDTDQYDDADQIDVTDQATEEQEKETNRKADRLVSIIGHDPLDQMGAIPQENILSDPVHPSFSTILIQEDIEKEILLKIKRIAKPAQDLIHNLGHKKGLAWLTILEQLDKLDNELDVLKPYASSFEKLPEGHRIVQNTMKALEDKRRVLERELCMQVKRLYKPNTSIKKDGHCLFSSIDELMPNHEKPMYYRKLAADYIRNHHKEFAVGVADAAATKLGKEKISEYVKSQGGQQSWYDKVEKKLGRKPTKIDFYCDCLENSNLWGGVNEIIALHNQLQFPVLIFTRQDQRTWRFDMKNGLSKFKDKPPLLLYYNGINHYQNLIPKSASHS